jgi:hypothetical protein
MGWSTLRNVVRLSFHVPSLPLEHEVYRTLADLEIAEAPLAVWLHPYIIPIPW